MTTETLIIAAAGGVLVLWSTVYAVMLSHTETGRALNQAQEIQPFLTMIGLMPVLAAAFIVFGQEVGVGLSGLFVAVGAPFIVRGTWRLGRAYANKSRGTAKATEYAKTISQRE